MAESSVAGNPEPLTLKLPLLKAYDLCKLGRDELGELSQHLLLYGPSSFDIDESVALSGNCDFPIAEESLSLLLGINQQARQLTVSLRDQQGNVLLARQVSTLLGKILQFFDKLTQRVLSSKTKLPKARNRLNQETNFSKYYTHGLWSCDPERLCRSGVNNICSFPESPARLRRKSIWKTLNRCRTSVGSASTTLYLSPSIAERSSMENSEQELEKYFEICERKKASMF